MSRSSRIGVLLLVQLVFTLVLLEVGLRIARRGSSGLDTLLYRASDRVDYGRFETLPDLLDHTVLGFAPRTEAAGFVLSSKGFRTPEYAPTPASGTLRLVTLGDSFNFSSSGVPFPDMWSQVAGRELASTLDQPVETISFGVPGVGPSFLHRLWELEGRAVRADVVVLALFVGNDLTDGQGDVLDPGVADRLATASLTFRLVRNLSRVSAEGAPAERWPRLRPEIDEFPEGGFELPEYRSRYDPEDPVFTEQRYLALEAQRMRILERRHAAAVADLADRAIEPVAAVAADVRSLGGLALLMIIPDELQVDADLRRPVLELMGAPPEAIDLDAPQRLVRAAAERAGVPVLDLLPAFRSAAPRRLYRPRDSHWNDAGNEVAGRALARFVAERLPAGAPPSPP